tara:strand:- start:664 stop:1041 length:378 start_codon:yes stop_codon:yes gene_type:complete
VNLSEVLNSINYNKEDIFQDLPDVTDKEYVPFVVNKCLSYFPDTILQANNMNMHHGIDPRMQYHYLQNSIRKRKRFSKWNKVATPENIELIKRHYGYSNQKAEEALRILSDNQLEYIKNLHNGES